MAKRRKSKEAEDVDFAKMTSARQGMSRASNIFRSFTAGFTPSSGKLGGLTEKTEAKETKKNKEVDSNKEEDENMSEDEKKRVLDAIMDESNSDSEEDSDESGAASQKVGKGKQQGSDSGSFCSDHDIYNRDLENDCGDAIDSQNYLRYASDKYN